MNMTAHSGRRLASLLSLLSLAGCSGDTEPMSSATGGPASLTPSDSMTGPSTPPPATEAGSMASPSIPSLGGDGPTSPPGSATGREGPTGDGAIDLAGPTETGGAEQDPTT